MNFIRKILTTDFCPDLNRYVYWLKRPGGWLAFGGIASLLVALTMSPSGWWLLVSCLVVVLIQLIWPWLQIRCCHCEIIFDRDRSVEWDLIPVQLKITNRSLFPAWGLAIERGFISDQGQEAGFGDEEPNVNVTLSRVFPFSTNTYEWPFEPDRRGIYPIDAPRISTGFPFGIWSASKPVTVTRQLVVWPYAARLKSFHPATAFGPSDCDSLEDRAGDQGDILGSRLWRPGESLRRVHWAQTAKSQEDLIVVERQSPVQRKVRVLLDPTPAADSSRAGEIAEWQIRIMATIASFYHGHRYALQAGVYSHSKRIGASRNGLKRWFDELARLDLSQYSSLDSIADLASAATTWLITARPERLHPSAAVRNVFPLLVTAGDEHFAGFHAYKTTIDIDSPDLTPFQQLELLTSACDVA